MDVLSVHRSPLVDHLIHPEGAGRVEVKALRRLWNCSITEKGCRALAKALESNPSHLRELDLGWNEPGESGEKMLSALLEDPHCKLEKLNIQRRPIDW
ncbi:hypothetical protein MHYP_G00087170 [Metynnis hypsauchen]